MRIGVISDTHGLVRPEALYALRGSELVLHAGDIGKPKVLEALASLAPVVAIRGNIDRGDWADDLPWERTVELKQVRVLLIHDLKDLNRDPREDRVDIVISGHSHKPSIRRENGLLFLNPGAAGPRRFKLPVAVAKLHTDDGQIEPKIIELFPNPRSPRS